jgi:hypothetical protein
MTVSWPKLRSFILFDLKVFLFWLFVVCLGWGFSKCANYIIEWRLLLYSWVIKPILLIILYELTDIARPHTLLFNEWPL